MLIGAIALFIGIGQKTFWAPPETVTATMPAQEGTAPLTVIEPTINDPALAPVELKIESEGKFTVSLGRSYDVDAWVGDAQHVTVTAVDREAQQLSAAFTKGETEVPNPAGDDIFFDSQDAEGQMTYRWTAPDSGSWSLLLAADGKQPAPTNISVTYANDDAMPMALPLIIIGALLIVGGTAFLLVRPNRKPGTTQHSLAMVAILGLGVCGVMLPASPAEQSADQNAAPSQESTEQGTAYPVVTQEQLERILADAKSVVGKADESMNADELSGRAAGSFRWIRDKRYDILKKDVEVAKPAPLETAVIRSAAVPNSSEAKFPRQLTVVTSKDNEPNTLPIAITMVQANARENYKVVFASQMLPASSFPGIAVGDPAVKQLDKNAKGLLATPKNAVVRLADLLSNDKSKYRDDFAGSEFIKAVHEGQKQEREAANEAKVKYERKASENETYAISTPDGGAIVTGMINSTTTFERTEDSDPLKGTDELTRALLGSRSNNGDVSINYAEPVMLYVPASGSQAKIQLIAGEVVLVDVKAG